METNIYKLQHNQLDLLPLDASLSKGTWIALCGTKETWPKLFGKLNKTYLSKNKASIHSMLFEKILKPSICSLECAENNVFLGKITTPISMHDQNKIIFILSEKFLITLSEKPLPLQTHLMHFNKQGEDTLVLFHSLLSHCIETVSSFLQMESQRIEEINKRLLQRTDAQGTLTSFQKDQDSFLKKNIIHIIKSGTFAIRAQKSIEEINQILLFFMNKSGKFQWIKENQTPFRHELMLMSHQISMLQNTNTNLLSNIEYLTDMTASLISIYQNHKIHKLTKIATVFIPPTLTLAIVETLLQFTDLSFSKVLLFSLLLFFSYLLSMKWLSISEKPSYFNDKE